MFWFVRMRTAGFCGSLLGVILSLAACEMPYNTGERQMQKDRLAAYAISKDSTTPPHKSAQHMQSTYPHGRRYYDDGAVIVYPIGAHYAHSAEQPEGPRGRFDSREPSVEVFDLMNSDYVSSDKSQVTDRRVNNNNSPDNIQNMPQANAGRPVSLSDYGAVTGPGNQGSDSSHINENDTPVEAEHSQNRGRLTAP